MNPGLLAITLGGSLAVITGLFALAAAAIGTVYWRAAGAWKEERDAERAKADRLHEENTQLREENAGLRAKTDLTAIQAQLDSIESGMAGSFAALAQGQKEQLATTERIAGILADVAVALKQGATT